MSGDQPIDPSLLAKVEQVMLDASHGSWEIGAAAQAMLEYHAPSLTPFSPSYTRDTLSSPFAAHQLPRYVLDCAKTIYDRRPTSSDFPGGDGKVLWPDGAVGDLGLLMPILLAVGLHFQSSDPARSAQYLDAVEKQADYLMNDSPRDKDGTMSHRPEQVQFWADFVYMTPPSVALWALHHPSGPSRELLEWSYDQCRLQRKVFLDESTGLWKHIVGGTEGRTDPECWATSNAWAAAGMLRVLLTIQRSQFAEDERMMAHMAELRDWVVQIVRAAAERAAPSGMIRNYVDQPDFYEESCGTALLAATAFRLEQEGLTDEFLPFAEKAREAVIRHIGKDGILQSVSDIEDEHKPGGRSLSAEGQAFVLLLEAAWRDFHESPRSEKA